MQGRLNLFQATMLRWRELHPYNAVHVVTVGSALEPSRLRTRIESRLETARLTGLVLDRRRRRFDYRGGPAAIELTVLAGGDDPLHVAEREIERQLNLPFPRDGAFMPFRFFAVEAGGAFHLGLAYDHFIAGGDSIAILLDKVVESYRSEASAAAPPWTPRRYPSTYARLFLRHAGFAILGLRRMPSLIASCRRSYRAPCHADREATIAFLSRRVAAADFAALVRATRDWGVTLNDLFLAMLLLALAPLARGRNQAHHRRELAAASIMNVRGEFERDANDTFGQFLASLRVSHPVPPGIDLRDLTQEIHAETARIKAEKLYLQTLLALGWAGFAWRFLRPDHRRCFLAKHYAIWAGVTNLNADPLCPALRDAGPGTEYLRAVPTGPLAPIVFAITTFGGIMQIGVSFRAADVGRELAESVATEFLRCVRSLA